MWIALFGLLSFGAIGFYDDYTKVRKMQNLGLTASKKLLLQVLASLVIGVVLLALHARNLYDTAMNVPFVKQWKPDLLITQLPAQSVDLSAGIRVLLRLSGARDRRRVERGEPDRRT